MSAQDAATVPDRAPPRGSEKETSRGSFPLFYMQESLAASVPLWSAQTVRGQKIGLSRHNPSMLVNLIRDLLGAYY